MYLISNHNSFEIFMTNQTHFVLHLNIKIHFNIFDIKCMRLYLLELIIKN